MQRERKKERAYGTLALSNDRAHLRGENANSVRSALDSIGQSLPERENARGRYLRIHELFAGKNPAAWCSELLCSAGCNLGQLRPTPIFAADLSILRAPTHDPLRSSGATTDIFSFSFTTRAPPSCVTETTIRWDAHVSMCDDLRIRKCLMKYLIVLVRDYVT